MTHLKQPADDVGPLTIIHDHAAGTSVLDSAIADLPTLLIANRANGLTAKASAAHIYKADEPDANQIEKMRRRLNGLVEQGLATKQDGVHGGAHQTPTRYFPPVDNSQGAAIPDGNPVHAPSTQATKEGTSRRGPVHDPVHAGTAGEPITNRSRPSTERADLRLNPVHDPVHAVHASPRPREHPPLGGGVHASDAAETVNGDAAIPLGECDTCGLPSVTNPCSTCRNQSRA